MQAVRTHLGAAQWGPPAAGLSALQEDRLEREGVGAMNKASTHALVAQAIQRGILVRPAVCPSCGKEGRLRRTLKVNRALDALKHAEK